MQSILISLKPVTVMRPTVLTRLLMDEVLILIFEAFDFFASLYLTSMADILSFIPFDLRLILNLESIELHNFSVCEVSV